MDTHALHSTQDWACALKKRVLDETGANGTAFLHTHIPCTNHAHQIIGAFKQLRWAYPDYAIPHGLEKFEPLLKRTGHIITCDDDRLESQPTPPPQHMDKVLNDTHLMFNHLPFLVDANKWYHPTLASSVHVPRFVLSAVHVSTMPLFWNQQCP